MNMKQRRLQQAVVRMAPLAVLWILVTAGTGLGEGDLQVYLLPDPTVESETITLEQIGIMMGDDTLAAKARAVSLGRFSVIGQQIVLDRPTVISRLASCGIASDRVTLRGAEKVTVRRNEKNLGSDRLANVAMTLLKGLNPAPSKIVLIRPPQPLALEAGRIVELKPRLTGPIQGGLARVCVEAVEKDKVIAKQDLLFGVKYLRHRVVAAEDLAAGVQLTSGNVSIETVESSEPESAGWTAPYGMLTKQRVTKGAEIELQRLASVEAPILVRRRQVVVVKLETGRMLISSLGEAQGDGKVGEFISVKMGTDKDSRIIKARIRPDGTLEPYHEGIRL
jgi:flagella basal body P-ring formation protein FlgA